jgi:S-formylglutathione hydrolase
MVAFKKFKCFEGYVQYWEHDSKSTGTKMTFSTFTPPGPVKGAVIWLSGLECNHENFITKAGAQKYLAEAGMMVICPDTSPRGLNLPGEHDSYDFGSGAGFYVNATTPGYRDYYKMYDYVSQEIYGILQTQFAVSANAISISGHSMGGHGALVIGLREAGKFQRITTFAPIVNPTQAPWGRKALTGYLGEGGDGWKMYDACELIKAGYSHPNKIVIEQGSADPFLTTQLFPQRFIEACSGKQEVELRMRDGYDHGYYFIGTFAQNILQPGLK